MFIKMQIKGEIIATVTTKKGNYIVSVWDCDPNHLPINGLFDPLEKTTKPQSGEAVYLIVKNGNFTSVTPLSYN